MSGRSQLEKSLSGDGYRSNQTFEDFQECFVKFSSHWTVRQLAKVKVNIHYARQHCIVNGLISQQHMETKWRYFEYFLAQKFKKPNVIVFLIFLTSTVVLLPVLVLKTLLSIVRKSCVIQIHVSKNPVVNIWLKLLFWSWNLCFM